MRWIFLSIYRKLYLSFGSQGWWPANSQFEVMLGALLTQNTSWQNVEKAVANLKKQKLLSARKIYALPLKKLAGLIRPAGYYNIKAKRLRNFLKFFLEKYKGSPRAMAQVKTERLRQELLAVNGIGPETADAILLYALGKPVFVVDAYTKRILSRHKLCRENEDYSILQRLFMDNLPKSRELFNEYHALLVRLGKDFCFKKKARCRICPLR